MRRTSNRDNTYFAAYKGDQFIIVGSKEEVAARLGNTVDTVQHMLSGVHHRRKGDKALKVWRVEDETMKELNKKRIEFNRSAKKAGRTNDTEMRILFCEYLASFKKEFGKQVKSKQYKFTAKD
ncbi:MAG: hypothetical protein ACRCWQ_06885 [Bacilli bacterium]